MPAQTSPLRRPSSRDYARMVSARVADMDRLTQRLADRKITPDEWYDAFDAILQRGHADAYTLGRQRSGDLTSQDFSDLLKGRAAADEQSKFLQGFLDDIHGGRYRLDDGSLNTRALQVRTRLYASQMRGTANQAFVDASEDDDEIIWKLGATEHCPDCIELAALSPYTKETLFAQPGGGDTECLTNCDCHLFRKRDRLAGFKRPDIYLGSDQESEPNTEPSREAIQMDDASRALFIGPKKITANLEGDHFRRAVEDVLGVEMSPEEVADVFAAPAGSVVQIRVSKRLDITIRHPDFGIAMERTVWKDGDGVTVYHALFRADKAPKGTGARIFGRQVHQYVKLGISRIDVTAAGSPNDPSWNGYYTWPRFGYNAGLSSPIRARLLADGMEANDLHQLFVKYGSRGFEWWKANGAGGHMEFDLSDGSVSRSILDEYLRAKGIKIDG